MRKLMMAPFIAALALPASAGEKQEGETILKDSQPAGAVPSEDSSGKRDPAREHHQTGNAHLRRIAVEAAWSYHRPPCIWYGLRKRQESILKEAKEIAWKAQHRLYKRYIRLAAAGKDKRKITTAVARELSGFIWAIGTRAETIARQWIAA
jgi:hypothetical protein